MNKNNIINIIKPITDKNKYKHIVLENELDVLFIENETIDKCALSLTVNVGFYNDPLDVQGLAHFLEHMLFMGTKQYPQENYFHEFINNAGGYTNAGTGEESTTYYFSVLPEYFIEAIKIFSYFFISPLFSESSVNREINAVDSEYKKNFLVENFRCRSILTEIVDNNIHPFYNFGVGSSEILNKPDIRQRLTDFFDKHYSANIMKLVVMSNKNIESLVTELYSQIPNKKYKKPKITTLPFNLSNTNNTHICSKLIETIPLKSDEKIKIFWPLPKLDKKYWKDKIIEFISYLLGHEAEGSIFNILKTYDLIISLNAGVSENDSVMELYTIEILLTDTGIKNLQTVVNCIYAYLDLIKVNISNNLNYIIQLYEESKKINQVKFDYMHDLEPKDRVFILSLNLLNYNPQNVIYGPYNYDNFTDTTQKLFSKYIDLLNKNNSIILIQSKNYKNKTNKIEKYYLTPYNIINNPLSLQSQEESINIDYSAKLHLPKKNKYIPSNNLYIHTQNNNTKYDKIKYNKKTNMFYKKNKLFNDNPKIYCAMIIYCNNIYSTAKNYLL